MDRAGFQVPYRRGDARAAAALHDDRCRDRRTGAAPARHDAIRDQLAEPDLQIAGVARQEPRLTYGKVVLPHADEARVEAERTHLRQA